MQNTFIYAKYFSKVFKSVFILLEYVWEIQTVWLNILQCGYPNISFNSWMITDDKKICMLLQSNFINLLLRLSLDQDDFSVPVF